MNTLKRSLALLIALILMIPTFVLAEEPAGESVTFDEEIAFIGDTEVHEIADVSLGIEELEEFMLEDVEGDEEPVDDAEEPASDAPVVADSFEQSVTVGDAIFTVAANAGAFPADAALQVEAAEDASIPQAAETAVDVEGSYTHRLYRIEVLDAAGNPSLPDYDMELPRVRVAGLDVPGELHVLVYDPYAQSCYEIDSAIADGEIAFSFVDSAVYDIVGLTVDEQEPDDLEPADDDQTVDEQEPPVDDGEPDDEQGPSIDDDQPSDGEPEPVEGDLPADGPQPEEGQVEPLADEAELFADQPDAPDEAQPVSVIFQPTPEAAVISVYPAATEGASEAIPEQADGSYLLAVGEYVYTAEAEGYAPVEPTAFAVAASDQPLVIAVEMVEQEQTEVEFKQTKVVNGVIVTVRAAAGVFPANAELSVKRVPVSQQREADAAIEDVRDEEQNVAVSYTFDIKVIDPDTGEEYQPADEGSVEVSFELERAADENLEANVYHVTEDDLSGELVAEKLDADVDADAATITATTDGFSLYTVEFTYNDLQYVLEGGESVPLSEILETVGLSGEPTEVEISNTELFSAELDENGVWRVYSHLPFLTDEWMNVTIDGIVYEIAVTDALNTEISDNTYLWGIPGSTMTMNLSSNATINKRVIVYGNVTLNLGSGKTLKALQGIKVTTGNSLTITGDGTLYAGTDGSKGTCAWYCAGIGGGEIEYTEDGRARKIFDKDCGTITINSGTIYAWGSRTFHDNDGHDKGGFAAGIGGGCGLAKSGEKPQGGNGGTITINGGKVYAYGGDGGAGIGGGGGEDKSDNGSGGKITITGGTVEAYGGAISGLEAPGGAGIGGGSDGKSGTIVISGGKIKAVGGYFAAGIGGGYYDSAESITIKGSAEVEAIAGEDYEYEGDRLGTGAGIGGGQAGNGGTITIEDSATVTATGGLGSAGIGGGATMLDVHDGSPVGGNANTIKIQGNATVTAIGGDYGAGIGGGDGGSGGNITIADNVTIEKAWGGKYAAGIGGGAIDSFNKITISGGTIKEARGGRGLGSLAGYSIITYNGGAGIGSGDLREDTTHVTPGTIVISGGTIELAVGGSGAAGIGGGEYCAGGTITITGGKIESALGGSGAAGIGGGRKGVGGNITISGATIRHAEGGQLAAGIGGGYNRNGGTIIIKDSALIESTTGGVGAQGGAGAAGIGGGANVDAEQPASGGSIAISGESTVVVAKGGANFTSDSKPYGGGAGIGAGEGSNAGTITISGGTVTATAGSSAAGIGGAMNGHGGSITISGGTVKAIAGSQGAGIGGGFAGAGSASDGKITIKGSAIVTAIGGSVSDGAGGAGIGGGAGGASGAIAIEGGTIAEATGGSIGAAGIGAGAGAGGNYNIAISGGTITKATGGSVNDGAGGAGIGGGANSDNPDEIVGTINITGGTIVEAAGGNNAAGIGSGAGCKGGNITISNATIKSAKGGANGAGIGGARNGAGGTITIKGSSKIMTDDGAAGVKGGKGGAGIGGGLSGEGGTITIEGQATVVTEGGDHYKQNESTYGGGAGIGGGQGGEGGTINIKGSASVTATGGLLSAGIGGGQSKNGGTITISENATIIKAWGGRDNSEGSTDSRGGAGIGGGYGGAGGKITLAGTVTIKDVKGGRYAAGIGGGEKGAGGSIDISGGTIENVEGGEYGAGIGGGSEAAGGTIAISGGTIENVEGGECGAGIGGGSKGSGGTIAISGGTISKAKGGRFAAGIGGGMSGTGASDEGSISINGSAIIELAEGGDTAAGIGGGLGGDSGVIEIGDTATIVAKGGAATTVDTYSVGGGAGIGGGYAGGGTIVINGGTIEATGAGGGMAIGKGDAADTETNSLTLFALAKVIAGTDKISATAVTETGDTSNPTQARVTACQGKVYAKIGRCDPHTLNPASTDTEIIETTHKGTCLYCGTQLTTAEPHAFTHGGVCVCGAAQLTYAKADDTSETKICQSLTDNATDWKADNWSHGWYAVTKDTEINERVAVTGDVNLVLCDGATLEAIKGITVASGNRLTIYAGALGANAAISGTGALVAGESCMDGYAGIGGASSDAGGTITINGGTVEATGAGGGMAIGKGKEAAADSSLTLYAAAKVTAGADKASATAIKETGDTSNPTQARVTACQGNFYAKIGRCDPHTLNPETARISQDKHSGTCLYCGAELTDADHDFTDGGICLCGAVQVNYRNASGADKTAVCQSLTDNATDWKVGNWSGGWYAVTKDTEINERVAVTGDVNLVLCDGATMKAIKGIEVAGSGNSLTVYAGALGDSATVSGTGALVAGGSCTDGYAGIGGASGDAGGTITINGGTVEATGAGDGVAIGKGSGATTNGTLTLYAAAKVTAGDSSGGATAVTESSNATTDRVDACQGKTYAKVEPCKSHKLNQAKPYTVTETQHAGICKYCASAMPYESHDFTNGNVCVCGAAQVTYVNDDGDSATETKVCQNLTNGSKAWKSSEWSDGWYAVTANTQIDERVTVTGAVNLILCDGATMKAIKGIEVAGSGNSLTVYAGALGDSATVSGTGALVAGGSCESGNAGIGGAGGTITITGGNVEATGGANTVGIGGNSGLVTLTYYNATKKGIHVKANGYAGTVKLAKGFVDEENGDRFEAAVDGASAEVMDDMANRCLIAEGEFVSKWQLLQEAIDEAEKGATITLTSDVNALSDETALVVSAGKSVIIDLAGYTINRNLKAAAADGNVITVEGGTLIVRDSSQNKTGQITGGWNTGAGGGVLVKNTTPIGSATPAVGAFTLQGGSVIGNTASDGGGVYAEKDSSFAMSGGSVTGNKADVGGGVHAVSRFSLSGASEIYGNTDTDATTPHASNVLLDYNKSGDTVTKTVITVSGRLNNEIPIGVSYKFSGDPVALDNDLKIAFTSGLKGNGDYANFASEIDNFLVSTDADGEGLLGFGYKLTIKVTPENCGTVEADRTNAGYLDGETATLTAKAGMGYWLKGMTYSAAGGDAVAITANENGKFVIEDIRCDLTVVATFEKGMFYIDADGARHDVEDGTYGWMDNYETLEDGWYAVYGKVDNKPDRVEVKGNVNLILCDDAVLTLPSGFHVPEGSSLTIWAQSTGDQRGRLNASVEGDDNAAIGGNDGEAAGAIEINGGAITAKGGKNSAGVGGGNGGDGGAFTINNGAITAKGGENSAGIGGGRGGDGGVITINGGVVEARSAAAAIGAGDSVGLPDGTRKGGKGGTITITGGQINAKCEGGSGAGIGGSTGGSGGTILITGGTVDATGNNGAGIGGGDAIKIGEDWIGSDGGNITIEGGTVKAYSEGGAGIGGGQRCEGGNVVITGGTIDTSAKCGAGIGGGYDKDGGTITIEDGEITAQSTYGAGIGGGDNGGDGGVITINGGHIKANSLHGAGVGGGDNGGDGGTITINGGNIEAHGGGEFCGAGIGGGAGGDFDSYGGDGGTITINGGSVEAWGGIRSAAIGGAGSIIWGTGSLDRFRHGGHGGTITISGGKVIAHGGSDAAGIGGGDYDNEDDPDGRNIITISGGEVKATGGGGSGRSPYSAGAGIGGGNHSKTGKIVITGGTIEAVTSGGAAAIGTGYAGTDMDIVITGGTITATADQRDVDRTLYLGAGIGGGGYDETDDYNEEWQIDGSDKTDVFICSVTIDGDADITANGSKRTPGIGSAAGWSTITINGCKSIVSNGGDGGIGVQESAGIGTYIGRCDLTINGGDYIEANGDGSGIDVSGRKNAGTITITGGTIVANAGKGAGMTAGAAENGGTIEISGGTVTAIGTQDCAGIGGSAKGKGGSAVTVTGGTVTAIGGSVAIGGATPENDGEARDDGTLTLEKDGVAYAAMVHAGDDAQAAKLVENHAERTDACQDNTYARIEPCTHNFRYSLNDATTHGRYCPWCDYEDTDAHSITDGDSCACGWSLQTVAYTGGIQRGEVVRTYGDAPFMYVAKTDGDGAITYASSDESVAKVDRNTGEVTILKAGEAVITATAAATRNHAEGAASYKLIVNKADGDKDGLTQAQKPTPNTLTYNGQAQPLVKAPSAIPDGFTKAQYSTDGGKTWRDDVPTAVDAGSYTVHVKYVGDGNHNDLEGDPVSVTVAKASFDKDDLTPPQKPVAINALYKGPGQPLVQAPSELPDGYVKVQYSTDGGNTWSDAIPTASRSGEHTVQVKYVGDKNHNDFMGDPVHVKLQVIDFRDVLIVTLDAVDDTTLLLTWKGIEGVDGYDIYFGKCGADCDFVGTVKAGQPLERRFENLDSKHSYKAYAQAWVILNGEKTLVLSPSPVAHAYPGGGIKGAINPENVTVKKADMTIKLGKTARIRAKVKGVRKGKLLKHTAKLRYYTSDPTVATVNKKGKVKAVGAGTCKIYVVANNGAYETVTVTVDARPRRVKLAKLSQDTLAVDKTLDLGRKLRLTPANAITDLTWTSSAPDIASVDANGVVTAHKASDRWVKITVTTSNGKRAKVKIRVK